MKLNKRKIAEGGLTLLAEGGLQNLSTRKLAEHFGIKSASLYYHFKNKQQLLDHVADVMVRPAWRPPGPDERWQDWLVDLGLRLRNRILAYPDGALIYAGASPPVDLEKETVDMLYAPMMRVGFSRGDTRFVIFTVIRFTIGWAADEQVAHSRGADRPSDLSEHGFDFGLRTIVRGAEARLLEEAAEAAAARRPD